MKLAEAVVLARQAAQPANTGQRVALVCGFTPLHLETFLAAHLKQRFPDASIEVRTGVYGDLAGNLERSAAVGDPIALVIEWADLDPRLGARHSGGWGRASLDSIAEETPRALDRILEILPGAMPAVVCPPTLPLPPLGHTAAAQAAALELRLEEQVSRFLRRAAELPGCRVVSRQQLDRVSPPGVRYDAKLDAAAGFPYRIAHADAVAELLVALLFPPVAKKGLITDLDDTVWKGILGEAGAEGVAWDLASQAQPHALYQQALAALAEQGVLIACASKNERAEVEKAFARADLLLPAGAVFPIEAHWGAKSESVARILRAWNVFPDSVVFVDDSPLELAEVQARFPDIVPLQFPRGDAEGVWDLLARLKDLFGKPAVLEEDRLRASSVRNRAAWNPSAGGPAASLEFLSRLEGVVTIDTRKNPGDPRPLELVNKTNQFNLNGRRYTETEWRALLDDPHSFVWTVSYKDKFGPLGKIAVIAGGSRNAQVDVWVMSCRAFSRRVEHHVVDALCRQLAVPALSLAYQPTAKNKPLQEFLATLAPAVNGPQSIHLAAAGIGRELPHQVEITA